MIRQTVARLIRRYGSNDPFVIASLHNILVLFEPLGEMLGYFNTSRRTKMIHINSDANDREQRFTCAHELGHVVLHPNVNTPFLRRHTLLSVDRIEREANQFAVELLVPDDLLREGVSVYDTAIECGVPLELADLKKPLKHGFWSDDNSFYNV